MAVRIRLRRIGTRKRPFYRVVVADSRSPRDGRFLDTIGWFDPLSEPAKIEINADKALRWLAEGAQPTDSARSLLSKAGVWQRFRTGEAQAEGGGAVPAEAAETVDIAETEAESRVTEEAARPGEAATGEAEEG